MFVLWPNEVIITDVYPQIAKKYIKKNMVVKTNTLYLVVCLASSSTLYKFLLEW